MADPGQRGPTPIKIADPSGDRWVNPVPVSGESSLVLAELAAAQEKRANTPEAVSARREQEERALQAQRAQAAALTQAAAATIRGYAEDVAQAVKTAAAVKPGPPAEYQRRQAARWVLRGGPWGPQWGTGQQDPVLDQLYLLREQARSWYAGYLPGLDLLGTKELDAAEMAVNAALIAYAKRVSGEA